MHLALPELIQEIASGDDDRSEISRVTFCGECGFATPAQKIEQRALDAAESARIISSQIRQRLEKAIRCPSNTAASVVAAAALAWVSLPTRGQSRWHIAASRSRHLRAGAVRS